jgi:penicillin-binding protein 1A
MSYRQRKARRRRSHRRRNGAVLAVFIVVLVLLTAVAGGVAYIVAVAATAPDLSELKAQDKGASSAIYAADGSLLGYVQSDEIRTPISWKQMPRRLRAATVAIEDERFYEHQGVDYEGIVRAGFKNLESGEAVQGGSTISQQLVRALYIKNPERTLTRKIREAKLASELEKEHSKRWILHQYLNSVPYGTVYGRTAIGIEAAAEIFFSKHARDLTLAESALLAGLPQAPSEFNPFRNPTAALERRNEVLRKMVEQGFLPREKAEEAQSQPLGLHRGDRYTKKREPYFFDYVEEQLIEEYGVGVYRRGGLKIHTTIDPDLQEAGRQAIKANLYYPNDPSSAIVAIDPSNGYIKAMASSGTYNDRTFNLAAQGHRQPGSAFKPFVLTTAIKHGVDPRKTFYTSKPLSLDVPGYGPWTVKTYGETYGGRMDLVRATLLSDNTVYAQLDIDLGPKNVRTTAKEMGITTKLDGIPSEGLGGLRLGVSPLEMANAYATLASGGMRNKPKGITKVEFPDGKDEDLGKPERKRVFSDGVADEVTKILEQNIQKGTGTKANIGCPAAGKTGTTDNFNDAWFAGYTPDLSTSVWVGYPNALREMRSVHGIQVAGGTFPAQIWGDFMNRAPISCRGFPAPKERVQFRAFTGGYASSGGSGDLDKGKYPSLGRGGAAGNSAGGGGGSGYDRRLYADPPQGRPDTVAPPKPPSPPSDGGRDGGGGGGGSDGGGGDSGGGDGDGGD